jgi:hypothetical protein
MKLHDSRIVTAAKARLAKLGFRCGAQLEKYGTKARYGCGDG